MIIFIIDLDGVGRLKMRLTRIFSLSSVENSTPDNGFLRKAYYIQVGFKETGTGDAIPPKRRKI